MSALHYGVWAELFNDFLEWFADRKIVYLTADREIPSHDWFAYLQAAPCTSFRIRISINYQAWLRAIALRNKVYKQTLVLEEFSLTGQKII